MSLPTRTGQPGSFIARHPLPPGASFGTTATSVAFQRALATIKQTLPEKVLDEILSENTPGEMVAKIQVCEQSHKRTKFAKVGRSLEACISRVEQFSGAIDQLAQGSPQPACLLWGCIKFVFTVSRGSLCPYCLDGVPSSNRLSNVGDCVTVF